MKVLVVDDDAAMRKMLGKMLTLAGHEAVEVPPGAEALTAVGAADYDVLLTDVIMPEVDGVELVRAARKGNPACSIIAISGGSNRLPASVGLKLTEAFGADAVLYKPFTQADLLKALDGLGRGSR